MEKDRIEMSQRERDVLKVMSLVLNGKRGQVEAARLLGISPRQVRRLQRRLATEGDGAVMHGLRGRPSNRRLTAVFKQQVLAVYRRHYSGFGPTLAGEKLASEHALPIGRETLRQWLLEEGLWQRKRRRDVHRQRRQRRACFGELVQADASVHDWLEGRGPSLALVGMIDDATDRVCARFHEAESTQAYMDVLERWLRQHGRPVSWYCDRHGIFRAEESVAGYDEKQSVATQFSRALEDLGIELILALSPQAKGRIERLWGTAQDRLVKELRLANACTMEQANEVLEKKFLPWFNRQCAAIAASANDAHRPLGAGHDLAAILSHQEMRRVNNDYTIRFENEVYQLLPPAYPGERGGRVTVQKRSDGTIKIWFKKRYLEYCKVDTTERATALGALPPNPRSLSNGPTPADTKKQGRGAVAPQPSAVRRPAGHSGRTAALPCPPGSKSCGRGNDAWRPAPDHPWRKGANRKPDISIGLK
jgi:transposase